MAGRALIWQIDMRALGARSISAMPRLGRCGASSGWLLLHLGWMVLLGISRPLYVTYVGDGVGITRAQRKVRCHWSWTERGSAVIDRSFKTWAENDAVVSYDFGS